MKLVVYGPFKRLGGLLKDGGIVDLNVAYAEYLKGKGQARAQAHADAALPANLQAFLEEGDTALKAARNALTYAQKTKELVMRPEGIKIWAPLPSMGSKIMCAGGNFADHVAGTEAAREGRKATQADIDKILEEKGGKREMWGFWKIAQNVIGPGEDMIRPSRTDYLDYEGEIAAIIGKSGKNIPNTDAAHDYIVGYTVCNDWSLRGGDSPWPAGTLTLPPPGTQERNRWMFMKNFDTSFSLGPCIVTKDEIDPYDLNLEVTVNGQLRQQSHTKMMIRKFPAWIAVLSRDWTMQPGDIIAGGTCGGTAMDSSPKDASGKISLALFLKAGDVVDCKIEGIGSLKNKVIAEK